MKLLATAGKGSNATAVSARSWAGAITVLFGEEDDGNDRLTSA